MKNKKPLCVPIVLFLFLAILCFATNKAVPGIILLVLGGIGAALLTIDLVKEAENRKRNVYFR